MLKIAFAFWVLAVMIWRAALRRRFPGAIIAEQLPFTLRLRVALFPRRFWNLDLEEETQEALAEYLAALRRWSVATIGIPGIVFQSYMLIRFVL